MNETYNGWTITHPNETEWCAVLSRKDDSVVWKVCGDLDELRRFIDFKQRIACIEVGEEFLQEKRNWREQQ